MAFVRYLSAAAAVPVEPRCTNRNAIPASSYVAGSLLSLSSGSAPRSKPPRISILPSFCRNGRRAKVTPQDSGVSVATDSFTQFKHLLLPITDRNPYLSEGTREATATTAALAKKYGADITVVIIDEKLKDSIPEHDTQLSSIRWHLSEGGFQEFTRTAW